MTPPKKKAPAASNMPEPKFRVAGADSSLPVLSPQQVVARLAATVSQLPYLEKEKLKALAPVVRSALLDCFKLMEPIAEKYRDQARELLAADPKAIPHWKLVDGAYVRELKGDGAQVSEALTQGEEEWDILSPTDFLECCKVSLGRLEEKLSERLSIPPADARTYVNERLGELLTARRNRDSLRRDKEGREE